MLAGVLPTPSRTCAWDRSGRRMQGVEVGRLHRYDFSAPGALCIPVQQLFVGGEEAVPPAQTTRERWARERVTLTCPAMLTHEHPLLADGSVTTWGDHNGDPDTLTCQHSGFVGRQE